MGRWARAPGQFEPSDAAPGDYNNVLVTWSPGAAPYPGAGPLRLVLLPPFYRRGDWGAACFRFYSKKRTVGPQCRQRGRGSQGQGPLIFLPTGRRTRPIRGGNSLLNYQCHTVSGWGGAARGLVEPSPRTTDVVRVSGGFGRVVPQCPKRG